MSEKQQPAEAYWPICPECLHEDKNWRESFNVGYSYIMICTKCDLIYHLIIVGTCYIGEIGKGKVYPMIQNRRLKVDSEGNLRTVPPEEE